MTETLVPRAAVHRYVSTACQHELHEQCRRTCKYCDAACACTHHGADQDLEEIRRLRMLLREIMAMPPAGDGSRTG